MSSTWVFVSAPKNLYEHFDTFKGDKKGVNENYDNISKKIFDTYFQFGKESEELVSNVRVLDEEFRKIEFESEVTKQVLEFDHNLRTYQFGRKIAGTVFKNKIYYYDDIPYGEAINIVSENAGARATFIQKIYSKEYHWPSTQAHSEEKLDDEQILDVIKRLK